MAASSLGVGFGLGWILGRRQLAADQSTPPKTWATTPLTRVGYRKGYDTGKPMTAVQAFGKNVRGNLKGAGHWSCEPGGYPDDDRPNTETVYILLANASSRMLTRRKSITSQGDFHTLPKGWTGRWDVLEPLRKLHIITP